MTRSLRPICRASSFPNDRAARGFIPTVASALALMLGLAGIPHFARAVVVAPGSIMLSSSGWSNSVNFENVLSYNPNTGTFSMPSNAGGAPAPTGWSWTHVSVYNPTTNSFQSQLAVKQTESDGSILQVYATGNTDPFLSYSFAVSNPTSSVQTYTFTDGASISPVISGNFNLFADIGGSVTNVVPGSPLQVLPTAPTIQTLRLSQDGGTTFVDAGTDVGPSFATASLGTTLYGTYSSSLSEPAPFPINYWQLQDQFTLTGNGDTAAFTGFAQITPTSSIIIPEPSTYAVLLGALSLGLVALRRKKKLV